MQFIPFSGAGASSTRPSAVETGRSFTTLILAAAIAFFSAGCDPQASSDELRSEASALESAFDSAAHQWSVPSPLLQAMGFAASRWNHPAEPGDLGDHGIMQLSGEAVERAAAVTGISERLIRENYAANIHAGAALLSEIASPIFDSRPDLDRGSIESWWTILETWSGASDPRVAEQYSGLVMRILSEGARKTFSDGSVFTLNPRKLALPTGLGSMTQGQGTTDYPGATWTAADVSNHSAGRNATVDRIILTTAGGNAASAINTFQDPDSNRSVHYLIHWNGTITQLVREENAAWHSSCYNHRSIGIMFEGFINVADNYTEEMYTAATALVRWITAERGLARNAEVIIAHSDVVCTGDAAPRVSPGEHFDWYRFLAQVNNSRMRGEVFFGEDFWTDVHRTDNRLEDVLVWLDSGQMTLTEGFNGRFSFLVPPGTYQVTAEADGYDTGTRSCTVQAEQDTWCSVMVTEIEDPDPDPTQGTLRGAVVWGEEDENAFDIITNHQDTRKVEGATVTINPGAIEVTTDADGLYVALVDAGTYTIFADADGYDGREAAMGQATLAIGETVWRSVMIIKPPPPAPVVTISKPDQGQVFDVAQIAVTGSVTHDKPIVSTTVNGQTVTLSAGQFSTNVTLNPGLNTITVAATDSDGVTGNASVNVSYESETVTAGVDGFIWDSVLGMGSPIEGATIRVGTVTATSEADGWFTLDIAAGNYSLRITAAGYVEHLESVSVPQGARTEFLIALEPEGLGDSPVVTILEPEDGETVFEPTLIVSGTVTPHDPGMLVTIDGSSATYSNGDFSGTVTLTPGLNEIVVTAADSLGQTGSSMVTVTYAESIDPPMSGVDGLVFDGSVGPQDRIAGATVTVGGLQTTTAADGTFSVEIAAGSHAVSVAAHGFQPYASNVVVPSDSRASLEIGLTPSAGPGDEDDVVEITFPSDGDVLTAPTVMVTGRINHEDVDGVFVNGVEAVIGGAGGFTAELSLEPGENEIEAIAFAGTIELGRASITVNYSGAGTGGCSCTSAGSTGPSALSGLFLLGLLALTRRRHR